MINISLSRANRENRNLVGSQIFRPGNIHVSGSLFRDLVKPVASSLFYVDNPPFWRHHRYLFDENKSWEISEHSGI